MSGSNLKRHALRGTALTVSGRLIRALQGVLALAILSRYLTPAEFGLMSMVLFIAAIAQVFTDFGTRIALVQRRDVTRLEENCVFWWNLGIGTILTGLIILFAKLIATLMGAPEMTGPLRMVAPIFLIGALQGVSLSVLERRLAFGQITLAEVGSAISGSVVAVILAFFGFRIGALVAQSLVAAIFYATTIILAARWRPSVEFSYSVLKPILSYGGYVTSASLIQFISHQADRPIVGGRISPADLGYMTMADQIVMSPLRITVAMVRKVMFPVMATIQNDNSRIRRGYMQMQYGLMVVMAPIAFGLWAVAVPAVAILLGSGWEMVGVLMGYMTIRTLFSTFNDLNSVIFSAKGWARFQFRWSIFSASVNIAALLAAVSFGVEAVVIARLAATIMLTPINAFFALRLIEQPVKEVFLALIRPLISALIMGASVAWVLTQIAPFTNHLLQLSICIPLGIILYGLCELLIDRKGFMGLVGQVRSRSKRHET